MKKLSPRQRQVWEYVLARIKEGNIPPTLIEIRDHFGWNAIGTVQDHVRALIEKGFLCRDRGARTLRPVFLPPVLSPLGLTPAGEEKGELIPVIGKVAAGSPILAVESREDEWYLDRRFLKGENNFLLRVEGQSMIGAQIRDGDYVLIHPQATALSGEIVVARVGEEVTVKRFYPHRDYLELRPENPDFSSLIYYEGDEEIELIGKVVGVIRRY